MKPAATRARRWSAPRAAACAERDFTIDATEDAVLVEVVAPLAG